MNIFFNPDEDRMRAGWRIAAQLFFMYLIGLPLAIFLGSFIPVQDHLLATIAIAIAAVASTILAAMGLDHRPWQNFGVIFDKKNVRQCALGFALAGLAMGTIFGIEYAAGWLTVSGLGWQQLNTSPYLLSFVSFLVLMILVGFYEELVFRGYQIVNASEGLNLPGMSRSQAVILAVGISSLLFGVAHLRNPNAGLISTLNVALAGAMLAFPFVITGRLSWSVGLHIGWNFFQGGVFGFPVSGMAGRASVVQITQQGPDWLTGGAFGPEAGVLGLLGMIVIVFLLIWYFKSTGQEITIHQSFGVYTPSIRNKPV